MKRSHFFMMALVFAASPAYAFVGGHLSVQADKSGLHLLANDDKRLQGAEDFVDNLATRAVGFISDASLSEAQKQKEFKKLLKSNFDMRTIGRFALGRYWRVATAAEKKEYQKLFEAMVVRTYSNRFAEYSGQKVVVRKSRKNGEKDITVTSFIVGNGQSEIQVDWRLRYKDGRYRVIDVIVEGVSMGVTQRSDFSSVIQRGGGQVSVLLEHLRAQK